MSASNFQAVMALVLQHEGGFTSDRRDPGNWTGGKVGKGKLLGTKYGIAANSFPNLDIANITKAQAVEIYRRQYAAPVRFDDLPAGVDYAVLDIAINSGVRRAGLILCGALATLGRRVKLDGQIGDPTIEQVSAVAPTALIDAISDARLAYMRKLTNWPTYGKGWTRRVGEVRQISKSMLVTGRPLALLTVEPAPSARGANAAKVALTKLKGVKTAVVTALGVIGEKSADILAQLQPFADVGTIRTVCTALTVVSVGYGLYRLIQANGAEAKPVNAEAEA
ncbi:hypothetical protein FV232_17100 [Methylobacterium sp. WL30]|uniref:glycoside hydrolase family 108 protein n=1 Tax=unclassified Methylobacterium TaxID=2615210 RepID=UPI0011CAB41A|nr:MULTISPECIES: glycosyl hydrolase 108 family protein [unclassified Methylobacterium]TXN41698.1 hypothetical protein FV225_01520 [Methylobacterium sp. WL93]TXN51064.1 hypothetical protein FV227_09630 [Methylobacterium sp. WL119]TXN65808.1 hypothetical protein FV232_17100 [Methylobacterium sp. WL30]TXN75979.1 hypothetical protein FV228_01730 [Methylobacterium sp. WL18]